MEWDRIVEGNRKRLLAILATMLAMATGWGGTSDLPRSLHRALLRLLRAAESAARRLVVMAARGLVVELPPHRPRRPAPPRRSAFLRAGAGTGIVLPRGLTPAMLRGVAPRVRAPVLPLLDPLTHPGPPRLRAARIMPRIVSFGCGAPPPAPLRPPCLPDDPLDAGSLRRRLAALAAALDDLPGHARRFARGQAARAAEAVRRQAARAAGQTRRLRPLRIWPFRPGTPPGQRRKSDRRRRGEVHELLADVHYFAVEALGPGSA